MNIIIEKIRAEIERRIKNNIEQGLSERADSLDSLLSVLSDLEKECSIPNDLEKYASRSGFDYVDNIVQENPGHRWNDHDVEFAHRDGIIAGAEWQREKSEKPINVWSNTPIKAKVKETGKYIMGFTDGKGHLHIPVDHNSFLQYNIDELEFDTLQEPTTAEGLEEEYKDYVESDPVYGKLVNRNAGLSIARHFYELGRQSKPVLSDDLEKAAREYAMDDFYNGYSSGSIIEDTMKNFKSGAQWGAEHLKK